MAKKVEMTLLIPEEHENDVREISNVIYSAIAEGDQFDITVGQSRIREYLRRIHGRACGLPQD